jgi:transposase
MGVVQGLVNGETTPEKLIKHIHGRITNKHKEKIAAALTGVISHTDRFIFGQNIREYDMILVQQEECLKEMSQYCEKYFQNELLLLCTIPGIQKLSAMIIIAELGVDLKAFVTAAALTGWAGLRPRNDESAKKIKSHKTTKGNKYLRRILVQCAWGASRQKNCWLKTKYDQLCVRKSNRKALIAIARKLSVIIWNVLAKQEAYHDFVPKIDPKQRQKKIDYHNRRLQELTVEI